MAKNNTRKILTPEQIENKRKSSRECQRRRRAYAREHGWCIMCCARKARPGYTTCEVCGKRKQKSRRKEKTS